MLSLGHASGDFLKSWLRDPELFSKMSQKVACFVAFLLSGHVSKLPCQGPFQCVVSLGLHFVGAI